MRILTDRPTDLTDREALDEARALDAQRRLFISGLGSKRIRVLRALTYEGPADAVFRQLGMSLPVGVREFGHGSGTITVHEGPIEVLPGEPGSCEPTQPPAPPRIHVADLDPDTLVGIALCEDGAGGWVVMQQTPDDEIAHAVGDEFGEIVYVDIHDAAEVLKTGKVWKHDMGEGEPDELDQPVTR